MNGQKTIVNYVLVYLLIFVSGSQRFNFSSQKYVVLGVLIALIAWYLFTDRKIGEKFLLYLTAYAGLIFTISVYTDGSLSLSSVFSLLMKFMIAYLILRTVGTRFIDVFIKIIVFLALVSVLGYISDTFHLFEGIVRKLPHVGNRAYDGFFYLFRHAYHPYRNNSIFFEPGAYQGFLNAALFMIFFTKTGYGNWRKWTYITILLVALITTFSTTGFVIFAVGFALFLYRSEIMSLTGKVVLVGVMTTLVAVFISQFEEIVVDKLSAYIAPEEGLRGWSAHARSFGAQTDLQIFKEHVFGIGHTKYAEEFGAISHTIGDADHKDYKGSSNGVTSTLAKFGLPYALFIFTSYYWAIRRLLDGYLVANVAYLMFVMHLVGEAYYTVTPISFAIIAAAFVYDRSTEESKLQNQAGTAQEG